MIYTYIYDIIFKIFNIYYIYIYIYSQLCPSFFTNYLVHFS